MTPTNHTDQTLKRKDSEEQEHHQGPELADWMERVNRTRAIIRERIGDQPLPDIDEMIDAGRDEWLDDLIAELCQRTEHKNGKDCKRN